MKFEGKIKSIDKKWLYKSDRCAGSFAKAEQFDWIYAFSLQMLLAVTSLFCILVLIIENVIVRFRGSIKTVGIK